jgi:hypothetical protein
LESNLNLLIPDISTLNLLIQSSCVDIVFLNRMTEVALANNEHTKSRVTKKKKVNMSHGTATI